MTAGILGDGAPCPTCRREFLRAVGMSAGAGLGSFLPRSAQALSPAPMSWLYGARHIWTNASVLIQEPGDRNLQWRMLRRQMMGGDPQQASPDGLIRNDLEGDGQRPSVIRARVREAAQRLLAGPPSTWRNHSEPPPALAPEDRSLPPNERAAQVNIMIQFYIRDISQDLVFPPPARTASVMLIEFIHWSQSGVNAPSLRNGPAASVETVVRSRATDWMLERLDAAVGRALAPWIIAG